MNLDSQMPILNEFGAILHSRYLESVLKSHTTAQRWLKYRLDELTKRDVVYSGALHSLGVLMLEGEMYDYSSIVLGGVVGHRLLKQGFERLEVNMPLIKESSALDAYEYMRDEHLLDNNELFTAAWKSLEDKNKGYAKGIDAAVLRRNCKSTESLKMGGLFGYTLVCMEVD